ncbi:hypothetical protein QF042_000358 [Pedobacter sp. W3I1]|uniref:hypothetical protein n=1 Tax=Pedobacter sp. W3I1 TaxID=3042291 RepID=UPI00277DD00D|nr:hypothetical protein [Pedobacter sp. W3I1]MDQ0636793.1 hypothetical protein [Pedobacter sp. W3I1]
MRNSLLIPNKYKAIGWVIFVAFGILGSSCVIAEFRIPGFQLYYPSNGGAMGNDYNLTNEFAMLGITLGLLMIVFAKERIEDEYISILRLKSLQWAVLINYIILIIINFSFYGLGYIFIITYNIWTLLLVFILKFYWNLYQLKREGVKNEK